MNRKMLLIVIIVAVVLIFGFVGINSLRSLKTVTVNIKRNDVSATIQNTRGETIKEIPARAGTVSLKLRPGTYYIIPDGNNISTEAIPLTVTETGASIDVDPGYSQEYLQNILEDERDLIEELLRTTYPNVIAGFTINPGTLHGRGEWYTTTLVQKSPGGGVLGDVYRVVLHKEGGAWKIAAAPAIVLAAKEHPSIPKEILDSANAESGY